MTAASSGGGPADMTARNDAEAEVAELRRFESLVIDLAAGFVNLENDRVDDAIEDCLRRIVEASSRPWASTGARWRNARAVTWS